MAYSASAYYGDPETSPLTTTASSGWSGMSVADQVSVAGMAITSVSNLASSVLNYKAAAWEGAHNLRAAKIQRDRVIRELSEKIVQEEAAEKVSLWESGLQYRGTAAIIEENNIELRRLKLEETRQYYADLIKDLKREERAKKGSAVSQALTAAGTIIGGVVGSIIPGAGTVAGAAVGGMIGGLAGGVASSAM